MSSTGPRDPRAHDQYLLQSYEAEVIIVEICDPVSFCDAMVKHATRSGKGM